jgi:DNA-binding transcriptional LysR family regulator
MNSQKWEALVTAIDLGSFSRAAEKLGYTQSGLTHMMHSLETELGFPVLYRGSFGVRPTEECERILPRVRELLATDRALGAEIARIREGEHIRVGASASAAAALLPAALALFRREFPEVGVELEEAPEAALAAGLESGRYDLILTGDGAPYGDRLILLLEEPVLAVLPEGTVTKRESLPLRELAERFLLLSVLEIDAAGLPQEIAASVKPSTARLAPQTLLSMVRHGLGAGLLPALSAREACEGVLCLPTEPPLSRRVGIVTAGERPRREAVRRLISITKKIAESLGTEV